MKDKCGGSKKESDEDSNIDKESSSLSIEEGDEILQDTSTDITEKKLDKDNKKNGKYENENNENELLAESSQENANSITSEQNDRRSIRIASILAIAALMGTICGICYKICHVNFMYVSPYVGFYNIYTWIMVSFIFACSLMVFIRILYYIWMDLKRYDLKDIAYKDYDSISDNAYNTLKTSFIYYVTFIGIFIGLYIFLFLYNWKYKIIVLSILLAVIVICLEIRQITEKKEPKKNKTVIFIITKVLSIIKDCFFIFLSLIKKLAIKIYSLIKGLSMKKALLIIREVLIVLGLTAVAAISVLTIILLRKSKIDIDYHNSGVISICHESNKDFGKLMINISDYKDDCITEWEVTEEEVLYAHEVNYKTIRFNEEDYIKEAADLDGYKKYWSYELDLNNYNLQDGRYYIAIICEQGTGKVETINMVYVENGHYKFTVDNIYKSY